MKKLTLLLLSVLALSAYAQVTTEPAIIQKGYEKILGVRAYGNLLNPYYHSHSLIVFVVIAIVKAKAGLVSRCCE